jgi:uncharacterized membrane protein
MRRVALLPKVVQIMWLIVGLIVLLMIVRICYRGIGTLRIGSGMPPLLTPTFMPG